MGWAARTYQGFREGKKEKIIIKYRKHQKGDLKHTTGNKNSLLVEEGPGTNLVVEEGLGGKTTIFMIFPWSKENPDSWYLRADRTMGDFPIFFV